MSNEIGKGPKTGKEGRQLALRVVVWSNAPAEIIVRQLFNAVFVMDEVDELGDTEFFVRDPRVEATELPSQSDMEVTIMALAAYKADFEPRGQEVNDDGISVTSVMRAANAIKALCNTLFGTNWGMFHIDEEEKS